MWCVWFGLCGVVCVVVWWQWCGDVVVQWCCGVAWCSVVLWWCCGGGIVVWWCDRFIRVLLLRSCLQAVRETALIQARRDGSQGGHAAFRILPAGRRRRVGELQWRPLAWRTPRLLLRLRARSVHDGYGPHGLVRRPSLDGLWLAPPRHKPLVLNLNLALTLTRTLTLAPNFLRHGARLTSQYARRPGSVCSRCALWTRPLPSGCSTYLAS